MMIISLTLPGLARRSDKPSAAGRLREASPRCSPRGSVGGGRASSRKMIIIEVAIIVVVAFTIIRV
eukprot:257378-Prorocentrum_minimum.AAC.1